MKNDIYQNMFTLAGKKALIPGGTGGLGSAIARAFLQNGADVAVCGGHPEKAAQLEEEAKQAGRSFLSLRCDIRDRDDVAEMLNQVDKAFGRIDILVNSAGMNRLLPAEDYDEETFDQVMDLNVKGIHRKAVHDSQPRWAYRQSLIRKGLYRNETGLYRLLHQQRRSQYVHKAISL